MDMTDYIESLKESMKKNYRTNKIWKQILKNNIYDSSKIMKLIATNL